MITKRRRNSLRLKGFDYSKSAGYFVTMCSRIEKLALGSIVNGRMILSEAGRIAEEAWREIPNHFRMARVDVFQVMPDHIHGIIEIREFTSNRLEKKKSEFQHVTPNSLHSIIRSFKAAVTREACRRTSFRWRGWQRSFHDYIIRNEVEHYFIRRYVELNPLMWGFKRRQLSIEELEIRLRKEHALSGAEVERVLGFN